MPHKYTKEKYKPDFLTEVNGLLTPVIMEVKKPEVRKGLKMKDEWKLPSIMKLSLDMMMRANVQDPVVVGLLIQGMNRYIHNCQLCHSSCSALTYTVLL